ncbi:hypothetical protein HA402_015992 [Bradysia odoriphaga]|nr:hypothetical protein HA402_015992 [Bradysia odoriphaga]
MILLVLGFAALAAAKTPTLSLKNSLEPPLDYIPVNSGSDISSKSLAGSKPSSNYPGPGYLLPKCPDGSTPPCGKPPPEKTCPNGSPPPCDNGQTQTCPNGSPPPCTCAPLIGTPPNCRAPPYLPNRPTPKPQCSNGGVWPECIRIIPGPIRCPLGWSGDFYPNCTYQACPPGQVGIYPDCKVPPDVPYCYKERKLGTWPDCYDPCPPYQMGRPDKEPFCRPIPCPTGKGWTGDFQPNCVYTPMCPEDKPGIWPDCKELYCKANFEGIYPDCTCRPGYILKSEDVCERPLEHQYPVE